jgi:aspartyl/asparaginyl beta-hydroxylase (cupin superfamily)
MSEPHDETPETSRSSAQPDEPAAWVQPRHAWQEGRCVTFDDTWEHVAWNRSDRTRVVLILDRWRPDLSEAERAAVTDLVEAIGDFNQSSEIPAPVTMK